MAIQNQQINFLTKPWFEFSIEKLKFFNNVVTGVNIPGITIGSAIMPSPHIQVPVPGDHMMFDDLNVQFTLDEELKAYRELYDWAIEIGSPDTFNQRLQPNVVRSDASILLLSSARRPIFKIQFLNIIPVRIEGIDLNLKKDDVEPLVSIVSFSYQKFFIQPIS